MRELVCPVRCHWALWRERFCCPVRAWLKTPATWPKRGARHCWDFSSLRNDLLWDSRRGQETEEQTEPHRHFSPPLTSSQSYTRKVHTYRLTPNMNTLGLWQLCLRFFVVLDSCSCKYNLIDALANEAHNEVSQLLIEDEGWRSGIRSGQQVGWGGGGQEWNPNRPTMWGEKRRQLAAMNAGCLCRKCWHFEPRGPTCDPNPSNVTHPH